MRKQRIVATWMGRKSQNRKVTVRATIARQRNNDRDNPLMKQPMNALEPVTTVWTNKIF